MPRHPRPSGATKSLIDQAAIHLTAEFGLGWATMPRIAEQAGVAVGSIYRYYPSREAMITTLYRDHFRDLAQMLRQASGQGSSREQLAAMISAICRFIDEQWDLARFLLIEQHLGLPGVGDAMENPMPDTPMKVLSELVSAGIAEGVIRPMPVALGVALIMGPIVQVATSRMYGRFDGDLGGLAGLLAQSCWQAIQTNDQGQEPLP